MDVSRALEMLLHGNQLKRTTRTGWAQRGVPSPENVAAHSFGVVYTTLLLADLIEQPLDLAAALAMAALHDLPEALTTDIPAPAWRFLPDGVKSGAERQAMTLIAGEGPVGARWLAWWETMRLNESARRNWCTTPTGSTSICKPTSMSSTPATASWRSFGASRIASSSLRPRPSTTNCVAGAAWGCGRLVRSRYPER